MHFSGPLRTFSTESNLGEEEHTAETSNDVLHHNSSGGVVANGHGGKVPEAFPELVEKKNRAIFFCRDFLKWKHGYQLFMQYLISEYCVECLLFVTEVCQFQHRFGTPLYVFLETL